MSSLHPIDGRISAPVDGRISAPVDGRISAPGDGRISAPINGPESGRISARVEAHHHHHHHHRGSLRGPEPDGSLQSGGSETPESAAIAELNGLISALSTLSAQAQGLPISAPTLPNVQQGGYQPQLTDYAQFGEDA